MLYGIPIDPYINPFGEKLLQNARYCAKSFRFKNCENDLASRHSMNFLWHKHRWQRIILTQKHYFLPILFETSNLMCSLTKLLSFNFGEHSFLFDFSTEHST
uniref:Uncharacterized protein n=1 Tax=Ascaris lumbricoides TaxID=6252 RepID=A0A9J2P2A2_ASCLU